MQGTPWMVGALAPPFPMPRLPRSGDPLPLRHPGWRHWREGVVSYLQGHCSDVLLHVSREFLVWRSWLQRA